jgi:hypothetical protein
MSEYSLPSSRELERSRRLRQIRLELLRHTAVIRSGRLMGCECGVAVPNGLIGHAWHRDHLAAELVNL